MDISVVIIALNEERRLEEALKSAGQVASEIIVVDSRSTDGTVKLAKRYTPHIFERDWTNYADQKNFANSKASSSWILSLDADERISSELKSELLALKNRKEEPPFAGFSIPRKVYYLGRWIRHSGWSPDRRVRLFRKDRAHWEGDYVHESLIVDGPIERLRGPIHHFPYRNIAEHLARINKFSDLGAQKLYAIKKKCRWYHLAFLPGARFFKAFLLNLGMLDGFAGLVVSVLTSYAVFARYAKLREIWKKGERIEPFSY